VTSSLLGGDAAVLVGGEMAVAWPGFVETVREVALAESCRGAGATVRVLPSRFGPGTRTVAPAPRQLSARATSRFGPDTRLFGGPALVLHDLFYAPTLALPSFERPGRAAVV
jgi:hypothetical protein